MSFFKKLKDEFKDLMGDDKDKSKESGTQQGQGQTDAPRDTNTGSYGQQSQSYDQHQHQQAPRHDQYPQGPPQTQSQGYQQNPPLPPGWVQQWDANSQSYYYIDPQTGRSQWEPPQQSHSYGAPPGPPGPPQQLYGGPNSYPDRGFNQAGYPAPAHHASTYPTNAQHAKSGGGKGGLIAAGVGGAAIGALGAAALSGDSSDEETHGQMAPTGAPYESGYGYAAPPPAPTEPPLEYNPELSSSQRSSLQEAREDLEEAEAEVREDSSASSSDIEDLQEAREEYADEVHSAEEELED